MKLVLDKYGRTWLVKDKTYTLLNSNQLAILNLKKIIPIFMLSISCLGQSSIIAGGKENFTIGETFPIMQQVDTIVQEGTLSVPKFEIPIEHPKPIAKKKLTFWQIILKIFNLK